MKRNNRTARRISAKKRQMERDGRTNEEQIVLIISRGGKPDCKEIRRLSDVK